MKIMTNKLKQLISDPRNTVSVKYNNEFIPVRVKELKDGYEFDWYNPNGESYTILIPYDTLEQTEEGAQGDSLFLKHIFGDFVEIQISKPINFVEDF